MAITMPGGYQLDLDTGKAITQEGGPRPQAADTEFSPSLDNILGVLKQTSVGFQAGLFAAPDYVLRKLAKELGGTEKDAFQLTNLYKDVAGPETSPRNVVERYAKTIGDMVGSNVGISFGILRPLAQTGLLAQIPQNAGTFKKVAGNIMKDLRENPVGVLKTDLKWGGISGATEQAITETKAPGEAKNLLESLAPAVAPLALQALPINLLGKGLAAGRQALSGGSQAVASAQSALAPGAGSIAREISADYPTGTKTAAQLMAQWAEERVGKSLGALQPGGAGFTAQTRLAQETADRLMQRPEFAFLGDLTPAERALHPAVLAAQAAGGARLSGQMAADEIARQQTIETSFQQSLRALGPNAPAASLEDALRATRDKLSSGEMGPLFAKGHQEITMPGMTPIYSQAQAGDLKRQTLQTRYGELDTKVNDLYNSVNTRDIRIDPEAIGRARMVDEAGEAIDDVAREGTLAHFVETVERDGFVPLTSSKSPTNILLSGDLTPATLKGLNRIKSMLPKTVEEGVEGEAGALAKVIADVESKAQTAPLKSMSAAFNRGVNDKLIEPIFLENFLKLRDTGATQTKKLLNAVEDLDSFLTNRIQSYGMPLSRDQRTFKQLAEAQKSKEILALDAQLNYLRGSANKYITDYTAFQKGSQRIDETQLGRSFNKLQAVALSVKKFRDSDFPRGPIEVPAFSGYGEYTFGGKKVKAEPAAAAEEVIPEKPKEIFLQDFDRTRRELSMLYGAAKNPQDARGVALIKKGFDEWFEKSVDDGFIHGAAADLATLREARDVRKVVGDIFEPRKGSEQSGEAMQEVLHNRELSANQVVDKLFGSSGVPSKGMATEVARRFELAFGKDSPEFANLQQAAYLRAMQAPSGTALPAAQAGKNLDMLLMGSGQEFTQRVFTPDQIKSLMALRGNVAQIANDTVDAQLNTLIKNATRDGADANQLVAQALKNPADMKSLANAFGKDPEQMEALRRRVWDQLGRDKVVNTADGIENFLKQNQKSLNMLYNPAEMKTLQDIADAQKYVYASARVQGLMPAGTSLDEFLSTRFGTSVRGISTTLRNVAQGRGGVPDALTYFGMRFFNTRQEDIYARVLQKALTNKDYADYLLSATPTTQVLQQLGTGAMQGAQAMQLGTRIAEGAGNRAYLFARTFGIEQVRGENKRQRELTLPMAPDVKTRFEAQQPTAKDLLARQFPTPSPVKPAPPAPATTGVPNLIPQSTAQGPRPTGPAPSKPATGQAPGPAATQSRAMYQALFPRDPVSTMLQQQQQAQPQR